MPLTAVIFDMDGTIVDSMPYHEKSWGLFFQKHNIQMTPQRFEAIHHGTLYDIMPRIFGPETTKAQSYELGMVKEKLFRELYKDDMVPMPGFIEFLEAIKNSGLKIGLATAADFTNADFTIDGLDIRSYFDAIVTSDVVPEGKPSPSVYLYAATALGVSPSDCLVFEDTTSGIKAAKAAGMKSIGITTGLSKQALEKLQVDMAIDDYNNLEINTIQNLFL